MDGASSHHADVCDLVVGTRHPPRVRDESIELAPHARQTAQKEDTVTTGQTTIDFTDDIIDVRDVIARLEYIEDSEDEDEADEAATLVSLLDELCGSGGGEKWRGEWYPTTLIRDSYFEDYARELADDIGAIDVRQSWPNQHIDWKAAAASLQQDYSSVEIDGVDYWYR